MFGNLYFVGNHSGASWLVDSGEGLILFDTNYPTTAALLIDSIWSLGFNPRDIVAIFHTHGHFDHFGATALIQALSGAKTYLGEADAEMFRVRPELALIESGYYSYLETFTPDVVVRDADVFTIGITTIRAVACPGHTQGAMSYFFTVTDGSNTLTAGLHGGAGLNTLTREFCEKYSVNWRADFLASIDKVIDEPVDIFLANHTKVCHTAQKYQLLCQGNNAFIDSDEWQRFLISLRTDYENMCLREQGVELD